MSFIKRIFAIITAAALIGAMAELPAFAAGKITYKFSGDEADRAGYAEGKVTLSGVDGECALYWADGKEALEGYYEIAKLKNGESFSFSDHTAIPPEAERIIAVGDGKVKAEYEIPSEKRFKYKSSDALYSFMSYSDIHIDESKTQFYKFSGLHWQKALETASKRSADFIVTAGDNITNADGPGKEFDKFQQILAESPFVNPVYEGSGNHELRTGNVDAQLSTFVTATGLNGDKYTIARNKPYYTVEEKKSGDLFIIMALEYKYNPQEGDEFSDEQLDWLEKTLKENYGKNKNIFLIQHALIEGWGAGDDENGYYTVPLNTAFDSTIRFRDIISSYPKLIWISGHTHIAFKYGYNYSNMNDTACHTVHDSSVCCPTTLNYSSHNLSYSAASDEEKIDFTEGYYTQVFADEVVFYGENLYHDKIYPSACYVMESCRESTQRAVNAEKAEGFTLPTADDLIVLAERCVELPKSFTYKNTNDEDMKKLRELCKAYLEEMYSFSSYDDYQALKKAYYNKNATYRELCEAYVAALPHTREGIVKVYFTNSKDWKQPCAKLSSAKNKDGDSVTMVRVGKGGDGHDIYSIEVNCHRYSTIVFNDGTDDKASEPQTLSGEDNRLFVLNGSDPSSPYYCYVRDYEGVKAE